MAEQVNVEQPVVPVQQVAPKTEAHSLPWVVAKQSELKVADKTVDQLAQEVIKGVYGDGRRRMLLLGDKYNDVQHAVNLIEKGVK